MDSPIDIARRLKRDARKVGVLDGASRYFAGWKLILTFGSYEECLAPETYKASEQIVEQLLGKEFVEENKVRAQKNDQVATGLAGADEWHLSASWRGNFPVGDGKEALSELLEALSVPEDKRQGIQPIQAFEAGVVKPQVTHWIWSETALATSS